MSNQNKDEKYKTAKVIELDDILIETLNENKIIYVSSFILGISLMVSTIIFPSLYSDFVSKFPDKVTDLNYKDVVWLLLPYLLSEMTFGLSDLIDAHVMPKAENDMISKLINNVVKSVKTTKHELNANELIFNLKRIFDIRNMYHLICAYVLPAIAVSCGLAYYFIKADTSHGIMVSAILVIAFVALVMVGNNCSSSSQKNEEIVTVFYDDVHDVANNVEHVIVAGMEHAEELRMIDNQNNILKTTIEKDLCSTNLKFSFSMVYFFVMLICNGVAIKLYHEEKINKSVLVTIFFMVISLIGMYDSMSYELGNIIGTVGNYSETKRYFRQFKIDESKTLTNFNIGDGKIDFNNISLKYGEKQIFDKFNLKIFPNSITGIMGEIGSGKTTLLKMLVGLTDYEGTIFIDGEDVSKYDSTAISKHLAYIPQNPKLFNRTILENLNYGSNYSESEIWEIIKFYDLVDFFNSFKDKLHANAGKNGEKLSGGQRQLIYILRSFIQNKKIILFDEPTSALDSQYKNMLMKLLLKIKNRTIMIVTHDIEIVSIFNRTLIFDKGKVIQDKK